MLSSGIWVTQQVFAPKSHGDVPHVSMSCTPLPLPLSRPVVEDPDEPVLDVPELEPVLDVPELEPVLDVPELPEDEPAELSSPAKPPSNPLALLLQATKETSAVAASAPARETVLPVHRPIMHPPLQGTREGKLTLVGPSRAKSFQLTLPKAFRQKSAYARIFAR
ncbi:MAG: hypothetical protein ACREJ3_20350 [Polyangiaceae bacterium]